MCWNEDLLGFALERYCYFARLLLARIFTAIRPLPSMCLSA